MDSYFKKEITYTYRERDLRFDIGETLFSTFDIDHGTDIFLRSIELKNEPSTILDIGCGWGPIGISLASHFPNANITMLDRDLLAVRYANQNSLKNNLANAKAIGSVGMEQVSENNFDLITSNIPAKIGDEAIMNEFILDPYNHLNKDGELWFVVVNALNRLIPRIMSKHHIHPSKVRSRKGHSVYKVIKRSE